MSEPEIRVNSSINKRDQLFHIDVALHDLVSHTRVKNYLGEMLSRVVKTALMEKYAEIQAIVDSFIYSQEARDMIKTSVKREVDKMAEQAVKDMFGEK